jgi:hypothetical protein
MPKRVLDGEGLWRSEKLAQVQPSRWRAEYANLLPLALANGVFEAHPRRIWALVYAFNRPTVEPEEVEQILVELERVKMLFRWTEAGTGKIWGFWVGIDRPGRLPGKSRRGKNEATGPEPPADQLRKFLEADGSQVVPDGSEKLLGSGSGSGSGTGSGSGSGVAPLKGSGALSSEAIASDQTIRAFARQTNGQPSEEGQRLAHLLKAEILRRKADCRITEKQLRGWGCEADRMLSIDRRSEERIERVINWAQADDFWRANVLSMSAVRRNFDSLELRSRQGGSNGRSTLSAQAERSIAGAAELFDKKAEDLERAFSGNIRRGG